MRAHILQVPNPGGLGLNQNPGVITGINGFASRADEAVIDSGGRLAARLGIRRLMSAEIGASVTIERVFEYVDESDSKVVILVASDNKIYRDDADGTVTDITGTATIGGTDWSFVNFNGTVIGARDGDDPIRMSTVGGTFSDLTAATGTLPTGGVIGTSGGRVWISHDSGSNAVRYSDLLDPTGWTGFIDLQKVWPSGNAHLVAVAEWNGKLVLFGKNDTLVYNNPWDSTASDFLTLSDTLPGVGCMSQAAVKSAGNELLFLSPSGVQSLGRAVQEKSLPVDGLSRNANQGILADIALEADLTSISATFDETNNRYILLMPTAGHAWVVHTKVVTDANQSRAVTRWGISANWIAWSRLYGQAIMGRGTYLVFMSGYLDDVLYGGTGGTAYRLRYLSLWSHGVDEIQSNLKILKRIGCQVNTGPGQQIHMETGADFGEVLRVATITTPKHVNLAEWGVAEWGTSLFSNALSVTSKAAACAGTGAIVRIGLSSKVSGYALSVAKMSVQFKIGREAMI